MLATAVEALAGAGTACWASEERGIETVTGTPPASFEAFALRNAAAWTTPEAK